MDLTPLVPYIPQLITAVATLGGVVLTLIFTGQRDQRRLESDEKRWDAQQTFEREKLTSGQLRAAYIRFLQAADNLYWLLNGAHHGLMGHNQGPSRDDLYDQLSEAKIEIELLAPALAIALETTRTQLAGLDEFEDGQPGPDEDYKIRQEFYNQLIEIVRQQMRQTLNIAEAPVPF